MTRVRARTFHTHFPKKISKATEILEHRNPASSWERSRLEPDSEEKERTAERPGSTREDLDSGSRATVDQTWPAFEKLSTQPEPHSSHRAETGPGPKQQQFNTATDPDGRGAQICQGGWKSEWHILVDCTTRPTSSAKRRARQHPTEVWQDSDANQVATNNTTKRLPR